MAVITTKGKFHVALDGQGLILHGAPDRLAYRSSQAPVYNARFGEGDRSYTDFNFWWFFAQTDWSGGIKDDQAWEDDAKFFMSANIDVWSEIGVMKLARTIATDETFNEDVVCGVTAEVAGTVYNFIGTDDAPGDNIPNVYRAPSGTGQAWSDITSGIANTADYVSQIVGRTSRIWVMLVGSSAVDVVYTYDGTTWRNQTTDINTDTGISAGIQNCRCGVEYGGLMYLFTDSGNNNIMMLCSTSAADPVVSGAYTSVFQKSANTGKVVACAGYNGKIVYMVSYSGYLELWAWDVTAATNTLLQTFKGAAVVNEYGVGDKLLVPYNGKLIITVPTRQVWELNGEVLTRIFFLDPFKRDGVGTLSSSATYLSKGAVISDNKLFWGNLMYDDSNFFNTILNTSDNNNTLRPVFSDNSDRIWWGNAETSLDVLYQSDFQGSVYKGTADKNYLIFSNFDLVSGIDKMAYSVILNFKKLASGQSIVVEYSSDELDANTSWTALGTASHTLDGANVTQKTLLFPSGTTYRKIWFRVKLNGDTTNTPGVSDFIMQYLPIPAYKKQWSLNINVGDEVKRLDGGLVETTARELLSRIQQAWWTKSVLDFQDVEYAATQLNAAIDSDDTTISVDVSGTDDFPEQGRIRIDDEEILYSGKTRSTFTGCTRGARDTKAVSHIDDSIVTNAFKVIVTDVENTIPVILRDKHLEYTVGISLREA